MKHLFATSVEKADLWVVPFWEGPVAACPAAKFEKAIHPALADFKGKNGETLLVYAEERILLLGLGKAQEVSAETLRRAYSSAVRAAFARKAKHLAIFFPHSRVLARQEAIQGVGEGILLSNYVFNRLRGDTLKEAPPLLEKISWIGLEKKEESSFERLEAIANGVYFVRELVNGNADEVTAEALANAALGLASSKVKVSVYDKKWLAQQKMGLILAVNQGSAHDPFLIQASYKGNPRSKEHIVLVGKGVTFDTGGLKLKTAENMILMKSDMAGGAAVLGAIQVASALNLKVNVTALVPAVENAIGSRSYKLGDVFRSYSGKTIEVNNTDGEGRLILADAISYAVQHLKPTCIVDLATLTGSIIIALGEEITGLFTNNEKLASDLNAASEQTSEPLWRMPIFAEYRESLNSDIADLVNSAGRDGGAIKAALFLQEFVGNVPWAHLDIAGPAYLTKPKYYNTSRATGYGVRLLTAFLEKREAKS